MEPLGWALSWLSPARGGLLSRPSEDRGDSAGSELGLLSRLAPPTRGAVGLLVPRAGESIRG